MSTATPVRRPSPARGRRTRRRRTWLLVLAAAAAVFVAVVAIDVVRSLTAREPSFASLAAHPDRSLSGTVAYVDEATRCVRVVAAAGSPVKNVYCLPAFVPSKSPNEGKEMGPQLVWREDGTLEVTMFRAFMGKDTPTTYGAMWQRVVDVRTGAVRDVPAAEVPTTPVLTTRPMTSPTGAQLTTTSDRGHVKILLTDSSGPRTLLDVRGPSDYTYGLIAAFWAPNWQWVAADDGRILVITPGPTPRVRVLTTATKHPGFGGDNGKLSRFAVTAANLLPVS